MWKIRVLFIIQRTKNGRNNSVTMINQNDWKKKIAIVWLGIAVEQMSYDGKFLPPSYLHN